MSRFTQTLFLPYSAVNANGLAKPQWLLNAFQDAASHQYHEMGISGFHMAQKNLKWVIAQYRIRLHSQMRWLAPLTLSTWRRPWKNLYEVRKFRLEDPYGRPVVTATGVWILIKSENNRPVRLAPHLPRDLMKEEGEDPLLVKTRPAIDRPDHETKFRVLFQDLDLNQHVNNSVYLKWALESMPHDFGFDHLPVACTVSYLKECFYPDTVICRVMTETTKDQLITHHALIPSSTGKEASRVSITWDKTAVPCPFAAHG